MNTAKPNILVIGGGAGGLELVARLGRKYGKTGKANVTLIDKSPIHIWKPRLHELAVGVLNSDIDGILYREHARKNGYHYERGELSGLNRQEKTITLGPVANDDGEVLLDQRQFQYDILVLAIGSLTHDFNTPGAKAHCFFLDNIQSAEKFQKKLLEQFIKLNEADSPLRITMIGAGATGVELAAELHHVADTLSEYGFKHVCAEKLKTRVVEAGPQILPAVPEKVAKKAASELERLGVEILTNTRVTEVTEQGIQTSAGKLLESDLVVWAAGVKAPDFLTTLDGLQSNGRNQLLITDTLMTTEDENIFAIGDCAGLELGENQWVPPRAQSAHQMADTAFKNIQAILEGKALVAFEYKDHGSLVSLAKYSAIGSLMGGLSKKSWFIEGQMALAMYRLLYRAHLMAIHGAKRGWVYILADRIGKLSRPKIKLH